MVESYGKLENYVPASLWLAGMIKNFLQVNKAQPNLQKIKIYNIGAELTVG